LAGLNGAGASAGKVDAMNRAATGAATAKQGALAAIPGLYAHLPGTTEMATAVNGMGNLTGLENANFRQKTKDIASAFHTGTDPWKVNMPKSNVVYNYYNGEAKNPTSQTAGPGDWAGDFGGGTA
jgi:hypothetical protein